MRTLCFLAVALAFILLSSCQRADVPADSADSRQNSGEQQPPASAPQQLVQLTGHETEVAARQDRPAEGNAEKPPGSSALQRLQQAYQRAKESGSPAADDAQQMLTDLFSAAQQRGGDMSEETAAWLTEQYRSLKNSGGTTASSAKDWVLEDIQKMGAWQYKTVTVAFKDDSRVEQRLNELGQQRWECFHVSQTESSTTLFCKRRSRSYTGSIPVKDLMRLLPLLGAGSDGDQ